MRGERSDVLGVRFYGRAEGRVGLTEIRPMVILARFGDVSADHASAKLESQRRRFLEQNDGASNHLRTAHRLVQQLVSFQVLVVSSEIPRRPRAERIVLARADPDANRLRNLARDVALYLEHIRERHIERLAPFVGRARGLDQFGPDLDATGCVRAFVSMHFPDQEIPDA